MKHKIGEQWIENNVMFKSVEGDSCCSNCNECYYRDEYDGCFRGDCPVYEHCFVERLGVVNDAGCLPEERTGKYPDVECIDKQGCNELWRASVSDYTNVSVFGALRVSVCCYGSTKQEAIDNWNRRY